MSSNLSRGFLIGIVFLTNLHTCSFTVAKKGGVFNCNVKLLYFFFFFFFLVWLYNSLCSFRLLNQFLPSSSILDKGPPTWHFQLLYIF